MKDIKLTAFRSLYQQRL